ncbi:MoxR family ATPase [Candidatus Peregrinibacteria bacterium]|nr:MAG: MoxR family ATPase [Candidatus Peregrinibacteria bacterium]
MNTPAPRSEEQKEVLRKKTQKFQSLLSPFAFNKEYVVRLLFIPLLIEGHILINDLPGVGKTTLAKAFARLLGRSFSRLQGTSDTLPQDILGGEILDHITKEFSIKKGPIFQEIVLIDEINRMHPKSQSAFLEAMEERQVSIAGKTYPLPKIHLVIATENPVEYAGTYPLPEAQSDRFSCSIAMGFPDRELQKNILQNQEYLNLENRVMSLDPILSEEEIFFIQEQVKRVTVSDDILERLLRMAEWSRNPELFRYGMSPRSLGVFTSALRAHAFLSGRDFVIPEDGKDLIVPFFHHRISLKDAALGTKELEEMLREAYRNIFRGLS